MHSYCTQEIQVPQGVIEAKDRGKTRCNANVCEVRLHRLEMDISTPSTCREYDTIVTYLLRQIIKADVAGSGNLAFVVDEVGVSRAEGDAVSGVVGVDAALSVRLSLLANMPLCGFFFFVICLTRGIKVFLYHSKVGEFHIVRSLELLPIWV